MLMFWLAMGLGIVSESAVLAQESALPAVPTQVKWLRGPVQAPLGAVAEVNLPEGYKFANAEGARVTLEGLHVAVPEGLLGVVAPMSGEWALAVSYNPIGHIEDGDAAKLDADALLRSTWERVSQENNDRKLKNQSPVTHVNWTLPPIYDSKNHLLQSAVRQEGPSERDQRVTYTARVLGRRGYVESTMVRFEISDYSALRELARKIVFLNGERYADYQRKDRSASDGLSGLIAGTTRAGIGEEKVTASTGTGVMVFWIALGAIAVVGFVGAISIARRLRNQKGTPVAPAPSAAVAATSAPVIAAAATSTVSAPASNGHGTAAVIKPGVNGSRPLTLKLNLKPVQTRNKPVNGHGPANGKKRRMFNYEKFYTEMMLQGPAPSIGEAYVGQNGYGHNGYDSEPARHTNGNGNGHSEHNGNGHSNGNGSASVHSEIIQSQKSLIEEQKRLIAEQARLIEEKSKLIAEKSQLLDRQTQLLDKHVL